LPAQLVSFSFDINAASGANIGRATAPDSNLKKVRLFTLD
jgi:hypothetical protein